MRSEACSECISAMFQRIMEELQSLKVSYLVGSDGGSNHSARHTASTAESHLRGDIDVRNVLVLAEEGQVQQDGEGRGVGGEDDDLRDTTVESLGGLVGTLLQLAVCLLDRAHQGDCRAHATRTGSGSTAAPGREFPG